MKLWEWMKTWSLHHAVLAVGFVMFQIVCLGTNPILASERVIFGYLGWEAFNIALTFNPKAHIRGLIKQDMILYPFTVEHAIRQELPFTAWLHRYGPKHFRDIAFAVLGALLALVAYTTALAIQYGWPVVEATGKVTKNLWILIRL